MAARSLIVDTPDGMVELSENQLAATRVALKRFLHASRRDGTDKAGRRNAARALEAMAEPDDRRARRLVDAVLEEVGA